MVAEEIVVPSLELQGRSNGSNFLRQFTSETSMFTRPVRITLAICIRHLHHRPAVAVRVPSRTPGGRLQRRCYATPPPQVTHRWVPNTFTLANAVRELLTYRNSDLLAERYHALSDATMDTLWESLEELLDAEGNPNYEVEYSVRCDPCPHA
jgi:hypothetical protein